MFTRILFPTDFSDHARRAMECISGFPDVSELILLHVMDISEPGRQGHDAAREEHARAILRAEQGVYSTMVPRVSSCLELIRGGNVAGCISAVATRELVDLIVMSAGGSGFIKGMHLGSVPFNLIHDSPTNQLIMRHRVIEGMSGERYEKFCPLILSKVLIPVDLSPRSLEVVRILSDISGIGEIIMIHLIPWGKQSEEVDSQISQAFIIMDQFCGELRKKGVAAQGDTLIGDPVPTIIRYADEVDASVICVVPHEKSRIREMLHGSFTCDLTSQTTRPVLILKNLSEKT